MDYIKKILTWLRKYHFWGLAAVMVVLLGVFWSTAVARLSETFGKRKSELDQGFSHMYQVAEATTPVNELVYESLRKVHEQLQKNVMRGWRHLYEEQTKNNPLPSVLGERFIEEWEKRGPNEELPADMLEHYWNFIQRYFPDLLKKADIRRPKNPAQLAGGGLGAGPAGLMEGGAASPTGAEQVEYEGIVVWDDANYKQLVARFQWNRLPTTREIRLAQEDLWVYETLLSIIKELNKDATSHYNAVVKRIFALDVAAYATKAFYEARDALGLRGLTAVGAAGGVAGAPGEMSGVMPPTAPGFGPGAPQPGGAPGSVPGMLEGAPPGMQGPGMPPGMLEGPGMTPGLPSAGTAELERLYQYRYVDQNEQPVPLEGGMPKHPFSEFKMMPIRMRLLMDQRKIPDLLVLCANSKMPIEVRQVRLNPGRAAKVNYAAARTAQAGPMMPGMGPGMEGMGPMGPMGPGTEGPGMLQPTPGGIGEGPTMGGPLGTEAVYQGPYDVIVEVLGIIYIYEPPDEKKLGTGAAMTGETPPAAKPPEGGTPTPSGAETPPSPTAPTAAPPAGAPVTPEGGPPTVPGATPTVPPAVTPPGPASPATPPAGVPSGGTLPANKPEAKSPAGSEPDLPPAAPKPPANPAGQP